MIIITCYTIAALATATAANDIRRQVRAHVASHRRTRRTRR